MMSDIDKFGEDSCLTAIVVTVCKWNKVISIRLIYLTDRVCNTNVKF